MTHLRHFFIILTLLFTFKARNIDFHGFYQGVSFLERILHQPPFWWWCFSQNLEKSIKNIQNLFYYFV
jgi:hypothetical protein